MVDDTSNRFVGSAEIGWIQAQLDQNNWPRSVVARAIGVDPTVVSKILSGVRKLKRGEFEMIQKTLEVYANDPAQILQRALKEHRVPPTIGEKRYQVSSIRMKELMHGNGRPATPDEIVKLQPVITAMKMRDMQRDAIGRFEESGKEYTGPRDRRDSVDRSEDYPDRVPIYRALRSRGNGVFEAGFVLGERRVIPALDGIVDAFALRIEGHGLAPRYEDGEIILINPYRPPTAGRWALVEDGIDKVFIGRVVERGDDYIELSETTRQENRKIPLEGKGRAYAIIGALAE